MMVVSKCCKHNVWVYNGQEGTSYYVCGKCDFACDTIFLRTSGDNRHDARTNEVET